MTTEGYCTYLQFHAPIHLAVTHHSNKEVLTMPKHKRVAYVQSLPYASDVLWIVTRDYKLQTILREKRDGEFKATVLDSWEFPSSDAAIQHFWSAKQNSKLW